MFLGFFLVILRHLDHLALLFLAVVKQLAKPVKTKVRKYGKAKQPAVRPLWNQCFELRIANDLVILDRRITKQKTFGSGFGCAGK